KWRILDILPRVLPAGAPAGRLTEAGARLLDPDGELRAGIPLCPPEGDAGTGMAATNSVAPRTGNVSAGTSIFAMIVLDKPLSGCYPELDMVTTPSGAPVAMVHGNNGTGDLDAWIRLFAEALACFGAAPDTDRLYGTLYKKALEGEPDCGGLLACNYLSGEPLTGFEAGRPLFARGPESRFTLANFMRAQLYAALGALRVGMDWLLEKERVPIDRMTGHGGFFKAEGVGQRLMAAALKAPVTLLSTAGEGGPWGMALLAAYMRRREPGETLEGYLAKRVFSAADAHTVKPEQADMAGFDAFMARYRAGLAVERAAVDSL
ncbi:MAG: FGGY-family carbohydrate kinase, partial [Clostridia bacterium]|nr:FGGY-family carbohydrate kinase [Clostridia bacterium]